jgi:ABC-type multidrug transport system fused ATPase/permease subunit
LARSAISEAQLAAAIEEAHRTTQPVRDRRINQLYAGESPPLSALEAVQLLVWSWRFIREHRRLVLFKCLLCFTGLTFFLLTPWPMKIMIDNVIGGHPLSGLAAGILQPIAGHDRLLLLGVLCAILVITTILIGMVGDNTPRLDTRVRSGGLDQAGFTANDANDGWSLWNGLFGYFEAAITLKLTQRINHSARVAIYERFLRSPLALYSDQKIGDAVFRVMHDTASIGTVLYAGVLAPCMALAMFVLAIAVLGIQFRSEPLIPIIAALMLPVIGAGTSMFGGWLRGQSQRMRERGSQVMAAFEERLAHVHLIKAFGNEDNEGRAIDEASWSSYGATLKMIVIFSLMILVLIPPGGALVMIAIHHLMLEVIHGRITLGDVVLLGGYLGMLMTPMGVIGGTWAGLQLPVAGLRRIHSVLEALGEPDAQGDGLDLEGPIRELEMCEVAAGYERDTPVLQGVSITLRAGEMAAIAGPSGCGKTTLIYTLPRFLEPLAGTIVANGRDTSSAAASMRRRIGFVFQQESLFAATIEENIRYGNPAAPLDAVRRAAALAGADAFIESLPRGYQTMLGRRGARLSVGQKQRIAIARALLRDPDIIVLDEPTAPLDPAGEAGLLATLRALARDKIVLLVAHRARTLAACDRVFFIHGGTVSASGSHHRLLRTCPAYREHLAFTESEIHA